MSGPQDIVYTVLLFTCLQNVGGLEHHNITQDAAYKIVVQNGRSVMMSDKLVRKLFEEEQTWHWTPWLKTRLRYEDNVAYEVECISGDSIGSFPAGLFTDDKLRKGAFLLYFMFGIYAFTLIAYVCNDYFIPSVEIICENLKIPQNVAAATFMSVATSSPEFFVNTISTFLTKSDMGIGTIVGSALFNCLGVAAIGGISAIKNIPIERRPVTRDVLIYTVNVSVLIIIVWDGDVVWYEAMTLGIMYVAYFVFMFNSSRLFRVYDRFEAKCSDSSEVETHSNVEKYTSNGVDNPALEHDEPANVKPEIVVNGINFDKDTNSVLNKVSDIGEGPAESIKEVLFRFPSEASLLSQFGWLYSWPIRFLLFATIPDPATCRKWYLVTFLMCIVYIGGSSYLVTWTMTVIGHTFLIPDSVMGMTFLAFGGCLPEACAIYIMSRRGEGGMGISNALGANSLAILFALGLPWLIRTLTLIGQGAETTVVHINSSGIGFIVGSLIVAVVSLWVTLYFGKFTLKRSVGLVLAGLYAAFVTFAILVEMGVIVDRVIPYC